MLTMTVARAAAFIAGESAWQGTGGHWQDFGYAHQVSSPGSEQVTAYGLGLLELDYANLRRGLFMLRLNQAHETDLLPDVGSAEHDR